MSKNEKQKKSNDDSNDEKFVRARRVLNNNLGVIEKYHIPDEKCPIISAGPINKDDILNWKCVLFLSNDRLLIRGEYVLHLQFSMEHPFKPPKMTFMTPIYHPNVNEKGQIDLWLLRDGWSPSMRADAVLISISAVIKEPINIVKYLNPECLTDEVDEQLDPFDFNKECVMSYERNKWKSYDLMEILIAVKDLFGDGFGDMDSNEMQLIVFEYIGFSIGDNLNGFINNLELELSKERDRKTKVQERKEIKLHFKTLIGRQYIITVWNDAKIKDVKEKISDRETNIPLKMFILFFHGHLLHDDDTLLDRDISEGDLLWMQHTYRKTKLPEPLRPFG